MTKQNIDYGIKVQQLYLELLLSSGDIYARCQSIFDYTLFDRKLQNAAKFLKEYADNYSILPTFEIINAATNSDLMDPKLEDNSHYTWLLEEFETFIRHKSIEKAIIQSSDLLEAGEYGAVEDIIKKAVQIGLVKDLGTNYFASPRERLKKIMDNNGQMTTGWIDLDRLLYGGMNRGELSIFCAQSGGGKSLFMANIGINWAMQGLNVVYITCELAEELVSLRMDAMNTNKSTKQVFKDIGEVDLQITNLGKKAGAFQLKYLPSGKNCNDIRAYLKEYELSTGIKVDVVIVDYLDLLMPISARISAENLFMKDKYVSEEMRNLAVEKKCFMVTASQLNRTSIDELDFDHSHISGGLSKIQTADNVFAIYSTRALKERGKVQLQLLKTRNSAGVNQKIELNYDVDTMRITNSDDAMTDEDMNGSAVNTLADRYSNLKRGSIVTPNTAENPVNVKKAQVQHGAATVKSLLNSINTSEFE